MTVRAPGRIGTASELFPGFFALLVVIGVQLALEDKEEILPLGGVFHEKVGGIVPFRIESGVGGVEDKAVGLGERRNHSFGHRKTSLGKEDGWKNKMRPNYRVRRHGLRRRPHLIRVD
jgi:hypothetical protein